MQLQEINGWIAIKELAFLINPEEPDKEYNAIRQRVKRGKYSLLRKELNKTFVHIDDEAIPIEAKLKYYNQNINTKENQSLLITNQQKERIESEVEINKEINGKKLKIALAKADLINFYLDHTNKAHGSILTAKENFVMAYNNKALPEIYNLIGETSVKTIERWRKQYFDAGKDYRVLAPGYKAPVSSVTNKEAEVLLSLALHHNQLLISEVVRQAIDIMVVKNFDNIKHPSTYRRWLNDWKKKNKAFWVFHREGEKGLNDKCLPWVQRDYDRINVGDIIVADGHKLNFLIVDPDTGKPKRMTLILFYDMKSNMPLGWEIMPTENTMSIAVALRRSILFLGDYPKVIYVDNGAAFRAKYFRGVGDFRTAQIGGLFQRIKADVIYAWPYHGQSKTIEPFFGVFAELERLMPTYSGTSIAMKPAWMNRGEKIHRRLHERIMEDVVIDIETAHKAIAWWFDKYSSREQQGGHLKGLKPIEIFNAGRGEGIDKNELIFLMMESKVTKIYNNGIKMFGNYYWNDMLFGNERDDLIVKYDILDKEAVYVFDSEGNPFCTAYNTNKIHPAASLLGTPEDVKELQDELEKKNRLKKLVISDAKELLKKEILPDHKQRLLENNIITVNAPEPAQSKAEEKAKQRRKGFLQKLSSDEDEEFSKNKNYFFRKTAEE